MSDEPVNASVQSGRARIPSATYRLQFNSGFTFRDATRIVPYLAELGVDTVYASPIFRASPGSTHGYDVSDYGALNPEIGGDDDLAALVAALQRSGMGLLLDIVPNHMGIAGGRNAWWQDVLENGPSSPFADFFDIDWHPIKREIRGKVLLPILGDQYGAVLERGELRLRLEDGAFAIDYFATPLPVAPPTYPLILRQGLDPLVATLPPDNPHLLELLSIITALERLPPQETIDADLVAERQREQVIAKRRLADLLREAAPIRAAIDEAIVAVSGTAGDPHSFDLLDMLLEAQSYRLAFWRVAAEEINYRRFFAINELAAIRQEIPAVFAATHQLLLQLIAAGTVSGVRVDHPDGLWDPAGYFRHLQAAAGQALSGATEDGATGPDQELPLYLVIEKILEHGENLPEDWAVHGTVGYDFATATTGLFVDSANRRALDELYTRFVAEKISFADLVYACKQLMMRTALVSEVNVLAQALNRISEQDRHTRDFTINTLRDALRETIACFPVYRTYIVCDTADADITLDRDRRDVEAAINQATRRNPAIDVSVLHFVRDVLLGRGGDEITPRQLAQRCRFSMKFQQLTGPVMAKGLEDTAFYRYHRLAALNEVGGDPARFGTPLAAFHRQNIERRRRWPHGLLAASTHDTKRSEDVRARIAVLSELPREWRAAINRWARLNRRHKTRVDGRPAPDRNDEYLLYQTLLGAWPDEEEGRTAEPDFVDRIAAYLEKAIREAQVNTSWANPNQEYEAATQRFVRALLDPGTGAPFLDDASALRSKVAHFGSFTALAQQLLKLTAPGVPDIYQGTDLWDLSLVDPDNRRPVDYARRARLLRAIQRRRVSPRLARELVAAKTDGRIKLFVTQRTLACRQERPDLFATGDYLPLETQGAVREHVCAYTRRTTAPTAEIVVAVPRLITGLCRGELIPPTGAAVWGDAVLLLPDTGSPHYRNIFTGETVKATPVEGHAALALAEVFASFPIALLERLRDE